MRHRLRIGRGRVIRCCKFRVLVNRMVSGHRPRHRTKGEREREGGDGAANKGFRWEMLWVRWPPPRLGYYGPRLPPRQPVWFECSKVERGRIARGPCMAQQRGFVNMGFALYNGSQYNSSLVLSHERLLGERAAPNLLLPTKCIYRNKSKIAMSIYRQKAETKISRLAIRTKVSPKLVERQSRSKKILLLLVNQLHLSIP